jgi:hypothetical protein
MLTKVELTDSEMASYASKQAMFLQPSKLPGAGLGCRGQGDGIQMFKMNFRDALGQRALNLLPLGES